MSKLRKALNDSPTDDKNFRKLRNKGSNKRQDIEPAILSRVDNAVRSETSPNSVKLTIKIGGQTLGEKSVTKSSIHSLASDSANKTNDDNSSEEQLDLSMSFEDEEMDEESYALGDYIEDFEEPDEEDEWLDALEEGRLEEVDEELKKMRDPKLMTARQRALLENKSLKSKTDSLKSIVNRESEKSIGEELNERKQMQNRRRRQMAEEKKERDKKQTIDKLLKKKQEMAHKTKKKKKVDEPKITYRNNQNGIFICLPHDVPLEQIMPSVAKSGDKVSRGSCDRLKCSRNGCENEKKYLCSKTKEPICSLMCYKAINQIT